MSNTYILTKTAKGTRALSDCARLLAQNECRILALVNGKFTLDDLRARVGVMSDQDFRHSIELLKKEDYVRVLEHETQARSGAGHEVSVTELDTERGVREWAEAMRAAEALKQEGYYVSREEQRPCNGPQQILIVDDESSIGEVVSVVLGGAGFAVEWIGDPRATMDKIASMPCLVAVLLDVVMPQENGFAVLRQIRAQMLTAHANPEYVAEGLRDGADGYILKPFQPEKLIRYLQDTLKGR